MVKTIGRAPAEDEDVHRPVVVRLEDVLWVKAAWNVGLDRCVQWRGQVLHSSDAKRLRRVEVCERGGGQIRLLGDGRRLAWRKIELSRRKENQEQERKERRGPIRNNKRHKPTRSQQMVIRSQRREPVPDLASRRTG